MTPSLHIHLAAPADLLASRVNTRWSNGQLTMYIDRTGVDPAVIQPLRDVGEKTLADLVPQIDPRRPPVVRYFLERDIPGSRLVQIEFTPYQADVYLQRGLLPQDLADELAAHSTFLLSRIHNL